MKRKKFIKAATAISVMVLVVLVASTLGQAAFSPAEVPATPVGVTAHTDDILAAVERSADTAAQQTYVLEKPAPLKTVLDEAGQSVEISVEEEEAYTSSYLLDAKLAALVDQIELPDTEENSVALKKTLLEALEGKWLVQYYDSAALAMEHCQALLVLDSSAGELLLFVFNNSNRQIVFTPTILDAEGNEIALSEASAMIQKAVAHTLSPEELEAYRGRADVGDVDIVGITTTKADEAASEAPASSVAPQEAPANTEPAPEESAPATEPQQPEEPAAPPAEDAPGLAARGPVGAAREEGSTPASDAGEQIEVVGVEQQDVSGQSNPQQGYTVPGGSMFTAALSYNMNLAPASRTGSASTPGMSKVAVPVGEDMWEITLTVTGDALVTDPAPADIVLVIDISHSMGGWTTESLTRLQTMQAAACNFIDSLAANSFLNSAIRIGIVYYNDTAGLAFPMAPLLGNEQALKNTINGLQWSGNTDITSGIKVAHSELYHSARSRTDAQKFMVILGDGLPTVNAGQEAAAANDFKNSSCSKSAHSLPNGKIITVSMFETVTVFNTINNAGNYQANNQADFLAVFKSIEGSLSATIKNGHVIDPLGPGFEYVTDNADGIFTVDDVSVTGDGEVFIHAADPNPSALRWVLAENTQHATMTYRVRLADKTKINELLPTNGETTLTYESSDGGGGTENFDVPSVEYAVTRLNVSYTGLPTELIPSGFPKNHDASQVMGAKAVDFAGPAAIADYRLKSVTYNGTSYSTMAELLANVAAITQKDASQYSLAASKGEYSLVYEYEKDITTIDFSGINVNNTQKTYGGADPVNSLSGWPAGANPDHFDVVYTRVPGENAGTYAISAVVTPKAGYENEYAVSGQPVPGVLTIAKKQLTPHIESQAIGFGDPAPTLVYGTDYWYEGFVNGDDETDISMGALVVDYFQGEAPGDYFIYLTVGSSQNYIVPEATGTLTVNKQRIDLGALQVGAEDKSKIYGGVDPALTLENWPDDVDSSHFNIAIIRESGENAGQYDITATVTVKPEYASRYEVVGTPAGATFTIYKKALTLVTNNMSIEYGENAPTPVYGTDYWYEGFVPGEDVDNITLGGTGTGYRAGNPAGDYKIIVDSGLASNYTVPSGSINLAVGKTDINWTTLGVKAADKNKTYGDDDPALTLEGWPDDIDRDHFIVSLSRTLGEDASTYTITPVITVKPEHAANYNITGTPGTGVFTINKRTLTVEVKDESIAYGEDAPAFSATYSGFVNGEDESVITEGIFSTSYTTGSAVGPYDINLSAGSATNYVVPEATGTLTVGKLQIDLDDLQVGAKDDRKTYGEQDPTLVLKNWPDNVNPDHFDITVTRVGGENAGEYTITATVTVKDAYADQYDVVGTPDEGTFTIDKKELVLVPVDQTITYGDDAPDPEYGTHYTYDGFVPGDDVDDITLGGTETTYEPGNDAGDYTIVVKPGTADNYIVPGGDIGLTVEKKDINWTTLGTKAADKGKIYGDDDPTLTLAGWPTGVEKDHFNISISRADGEDASTYTITPVITVKPEHAANYNITGTPRTGVFTINKRTLTVEVKDESIAYGEDAPAFSATYSGFVNGEDESVITEGIFSTSYTTGSAVGPYDINLSAGSATNYVVPEATGTLTVGKLQIDLDSLQVGAKDDRKTYGEQDPTLVLKNWPDNVNPDHFDITVTRVGGENAGEYTITATVTVKDSYADQYDVIGTPDEGTFTIDKKELVLVPVDQTIIYGDDAPDPEYGTHYTYDGFVPGDDVDNITLGGTETTYEPGNDAGDYTIVVKPGTADNYIVPGGDIGLTVEKKDINWTTLGTKAADKGKIYGDDDPTLTLAGWPTGVEKDHFNISISRADGEDANTYTITPVITVKPEYAANYNITGTPGTGIFTINKRTLTVEVQNESIAYGEDAPAFSATYTGFVNGEDESVITEGLFSTNYTTGSAVGPYDINLSAGSATNYIVPEATGTLTVGKLQIDLDSLQVGAKDDRKTYGEQDPTLVLKNWPDNINPGHFDIVVERETGENAGEYTITATVTVKDAYADQYDVVGTPDEGTFTIDKKQLTIVTNDQTVPFGDEAPDPVYGTEYWYEGFVPGDDVNDINLGGFETGYKPGDTGDHTVTIKPGAADNYIVPGGSLDLTVAKKTIDWTQLGTKAADNSKVYGDTDPELTLEGWPVGINRDHFDVSLNRAPGEDASTYDIFATVSAKPAYAAYYNLVGNPSNGIFTITKRTLMAVPSANPNKFETGSKVPDYSITYTGFVNGDDESVLRDADTVKVVSSYAPADTFNGSKTYPLYVDIGSVNADNYIVMAGTGSMYVTGSWRYTVEFYKDSLDNENYLGYYEDSVTVGGGWANVDTGRFMPQGAYRAEVVGEQWVSHNDYTIFVVYVKGSAATSNTTPAITTPPTNSTPPKVGPTAANGPEHRENANIGEGGIPMQGTERRSAWALVNLILSVVGILTALITLITFFVRKKEEIEKDEYGEAVMDDLGEEVTQEYKKHGGLKALSALVALLSVIVFFITENMRMPMVYVDKWTALMALLLLGQLLITLFARRRKVEDEGEEPAEGEPETSSGE